jgi:hypothetical protein
MIGEWFDKYISQPVKSFYNYVTGNTEQPGPEGSTDFSADQHDIIPSSGDNDII